MTTRLGESQSWEDDRLATIAQDQHLLKSFQTLKYVNSEFFTNQRSGNANCLTSYLCSRSFGTSIVMIGFNEKLMQEILDHSYL